MFNIQCLIEVKIKQKWVYHGINDLKSFSEIDYHIFGFLSGVGFKYITPISLPKGLPENCCKEVYIKNDSFRIKKVICSFFILKDLLKFKYEKKVNKYLGAKTYKEFLKDSFFEDIKELKKIGDQNRIRIVFWIYFNYNK